MNNIPLYILSFLLMLCCIVWYAKNIIAIAVVIAVVCWPENMPVYASIPSYITALSSGFNIPKRNGMLNNIKYWLITNPNLKRTSFDLNLLTK